MSLQFISNKYVSTSCNLEELKTKKHYYLKSLQFVSNKYVSMSCNLEEEKGEKL